MRRTRLTSGHRTTLWLGLLLTWALGVPAVSQAKSKASASASSARVVAVFPLATKGRVNSEILGAAQTILNAGVKGQTQLHILSGNTLKKKLSTDPLAALASCERKSDSGSCLARLAKKLAVSELLVGRAGEQDGRVKVLLLAVQLSGAIVPRAKLELSSADDVGRQLGLDKLHQIFGMTAPTTESSKVALASRGTESAIGTPTVLAPASQTKERDAGNSQAEAKPVSHSDTIATVRVETPAPAGDSVRVPEIVMVLPPPDKLRSAAVDPKLNAALTFPPPTSRAEVSASNALTSTPLLTSSARMRTWWSSGVLRYTGLVLAAAGAAGLGYGVYSGNHAQSVRSTIKRDGSLVQREAAQRYEQANELSSRANLLLLVGGAVAVVGAGLFGLDLGLQSPDDS